MSGINRQVILMARPVGVAQAGGFAIVGTPVTPPAEGEILVQGAFLSVGHAARLDRRGTLALPGGDARGIEACPDAVAGLGRGENMGKRLIRLAR